MNRFLPPLLVMMTLLWPRATVTAASPQTSMWSTLSRQQQQDLSDGKPIVLEEEVEGNAWPRFIVYQVVTSSAAQAAAVFWDCQLDPKYVPNCLSVHLVSEPKPWIHDGEYTLRMPMFLPNEVYVSRNEMKTPAPGIYQIEWKVLHASYIKGSTGNIRIEPLTQDQLHCQSGEHSLMRYSNLVVPGSSIARLLRSNARSQVVESVQALAHQIEQEVAKSRIFSNSNFRKWMTLSSPSLLKSEFVFTPYSFELGMGLG